MLTSVLRIKLCLVGAARTAPGRCAVGAHAVAVLAAARTSRANPSEAAGSRGWPLAARAIPVRPARVPRAGNPHFLVSPGATESAPQAQPPRTPPPEQPDDSWKIKFRSRTPSPARSWCWTARQCAASRVLFSIETPVLLTAPGRCAVGANSVAPGETRAKRGIRNAQRCARAAGSPCKANRGMGGLPSGGTHEGRAGVVSAASGHAREPAASEGFAREVRAQRGPQRHARPGPSLHAPRKRSTPPPPPHHPA